MANLASDLGVFGAPGLGGYVASKHGVLGLTKVAALECERRGIRVPDPGGRSPSGGGGRRRQPDALEGRRPQHNGGVEPVPARSGES